MIVTNCAILGRADAFAARNSLFWSVLDGLMTGLGFAIILILLGALREILGQGTLFSDMHLLLGETAVDWTLLIFSDYSGFLFAILPPGAFIGLGLLIALKNIIDQHLENRQVAKNLLIKSDSKRVRIKMV